uniref:Ionotropic glutamate receptor C-terminal domain-containing protein n=1 Tax=Daphnia galeata TaxID=27404 RepID=A0A8J2RE31_9CRUS|nr:unnamed protein product [Daphnia galeata]
MYYLGLFLWFAIISNCGISSTTTTNMLRGKHLRVIWPRWSGNPKGLWGPLKGGVVLDFLSARLNFTYEMVRVTENILEPQPEKRGLFNYLWDQQCDLIITDVLVLFYRSKIDLTTPWIFADLGLLIPVDDDIANTNAVIKPFQWPVWLGLGVSIVCVTATLILILRFSFHLSTIWRSNTIEVETGNEENVRTPERDGRLSVMENKCRKQYLYVIGNLLSQGDSCASELLSFRFVAGVWCLAAFIFVQAYTSTLITYVVMPINPPLINSINDVFENRDIQLLIYKIAPLNIFSSEPNATGIYLKLGNKLNSFTNSRCSSISECVKAITPGSKKVFVEAANYIKDAIKEDFYKTGKCKFQLAKERFMPMGISFAMQQNSPYTKSINQGILELQQTGINDIWDLWFRPMPPQSLFLWFAIISNCGISSTTTTNMLRGKHLRVIWPRWSGNPKGLWGPLKGGVVLDFLSARLNFTYEMVRVTENILEPQPEKRGQFNYLWDQQCDLIITDVTAPFYRSKIDLTTPWIFADYGLLIPVDDDIANTNAVIKPFQWPVWLGLGVSIVFVTATLILILRFSFHLSTIWRSNTIEVETGNEENVRTPERDGRLSVMENKCRKQYLYVIGNLLSQGGSCASELLSFRFVAGVWCLAAFIFVQAYTSTLITYIVTPNNPPLINSINDVFENRDIQLLIFKVAPLNIFSSEPNATGIYLKLGNKLNSFTNSRCSSISECVKAITPGSKKVYVEGANYIKDAIKEDFYKTGKCKLQLAKERFMPLGISFALQQNSPYTKSINQGILELQQTGINDIWDLWFRPMPPQCNGKPVQSPKTEKKLSPLSLKNLSGAFLLLAFGLSLSFLVFLIEKIYQFHK